MTHLILKRNDIDESQKKIYGTTVKKYHRDILITSDRGILTSYFFQLFILSSLFKLFYESRQVLTLNSVDHRLIFKNYIFIFFIDYRLN